MLKIIQKFSGNIGIMTAADRRPITQYRYDKQVLAGTGRSLFTSC